MASKELISAAEAAGLHVFGHPDTVLGIPTPWEIVEDSQGFLNIHHPREDDGAQTGDLVATCFQDERHAALLRAAPEMLRALEKAVARFARIKDVLNSDRLGDYTRRVSFSNDVWHMECEARAMVAAAQKADL